MEQNLGEEVLVVVPEVQLHQVNSGKESLLAWTSLKLLLTPPSNGSVAGTVVAQVGELRWELDASMPTLKANEQTYMFALPGGQTFYSVLLAKETSEEVRATFEAVLLECTAFQVSGQQLSKEENDKLLDEVTQSVLEEEEVINAAGPSGQAAVKKADKTSEKIMAGASRVSEGIAAATVWATANIAKGGELLKQHTRPRDQKVQISPETMARVKQARRTAGKGAAIAGTIAAGVADMSVRVAQAIVTKMSNTDYGRRLASNPSARAVAAREVASASVVAAAQIFDTMEQASRIVLHASGSTTAEFITHKYGEDSGEVVRDAGYAVTDVYLATTHMKKMGLRTVAKRIAKHTAAGMVRDSLQQQQGQGSQQALPPPPAPLQRTKVTRQGSIASGGMPGMPAISESGRLPSGMWGRERERERDFACVPGVPRMGGIAAGLQPRPITRRPSSGGEVAPPAPAPVPPAGGNFPGQYW